MNIYEGIFYSERLIMHDIGFLTRTCKLFEKNKIHKICTVTSFCNQASFNCEFMCYYQVRDLCEPHIIKAHLKPLLNRPHMPRVYVDLVTSERLLTVPISSRTSTFPTHTSIRCQSTQVIHTKEALN